VAAVLDGARSAGPCRLVPVLSGWADLDQGEDAADIGPGHPILIYPEYRLDPLLARFRGIGGSKWQRELAALRLVYEWAEKEQRGRAQPGPGPPGTAARRR